MLHRHQLGVKKTQHPRCSPYWLQHWPDGHFILLPDPQAPPWGAVPEMGVVGAETGPPEAGQATLAGQSQTLARSLNRVPEGQEYSHPVDPAGQHGWREGH